MPEPELVCNVCGGTEFIDLRRRQKVRCVECRTVERGRLLYMALLDLDLIKPNAKVLHIAPEAGIGRQIRKVVQNGYHGVDLHHKRFPSDLGVRKFNLVTDAEKLPSHTYDLVVHSHVMEHIPCDTTMVLLHLHRSLKATGKHVFCIPISKGNYKSNFNPMSGEDRTNEFGQFDHVRRFGRADLNHHIGMVFHLTPYDPLVLHSRNEILRMNAPLPKPGVVTSNTIFVQEKNSLRVQV